MAIEELMKEEAYRQQFVTMVAKLNEMVNSYLAEGDDDKARSLIARVMAKIDSMPEGSWRDKYRREIGGKFSRLFEAKGIPLSNWSED